ncbi:MAG: Gp138 family membrane-puncturing spike protein [Maricaulaceae bacterium]
MAEAYDRQTTAGNDTDTLREILRSDHLHRRTVQVGQIISFDPMCQSALVQLGIQMNLNGTLVDVAPIPDVPVVFPMAGQRGLSYPVRQGDQCLVVFADRAIGRWLDRGGTVDPEDTRIKHLTDAICIPGLSSCANPIEDFNNNAVKITGGDEAFMTLGEDNIHMETQNTNADFTEDKITLTTDNAKIEIGENCLAFKAGGNELLQVLIEFANGVTPPRTDIAAKLIAMKCP